MTTAARIRGRTITGTATGAVAVAVVALTALLSAGPAANAGAITATRAGAARDTLAGQASLCAPPSDQVPPSVTGLTLSASSVRVTKAAATVTVTATAMDTSGGGDPSGVKRVEVSLFGHRHGATARLALVSGTVDDGTWQGAFTVPRYTPSSTWRVDDVEVVDRDGNEQSYTGGHTSAASPTDLTRQSGWAQSLAVVGGGTAPDVRPGRLKAFELTPGAVTTTHEPAAVRVTARFDGRQPRAVQVYFASIEGPRSRGRGLFKNISLSPTGDGVWTGRLGVPRWVGVSRAAPQVTATYGAAVSHRFQEYDATWLRHEGLPSALSITSGVDVTKPTLTALTITPSTIDSTTGAQVATVTAAANDIGSGVRRVSVFFSYRSFQGYLPGSFTQATLQPDGTAWSGQVTFPRCVPSGSWAAEVYVVDWAGNGADYTSRRLARAGLPSTLAVTSKPGDVTPPEVVAATASGVDHTITLDFDEGVRTVTTSTVSVYAMTPVSARFTATTAVSAITCSDGTSTISCAGSGSHVTSAVLDVPSLTGGARFQVWANQGEATPQLRDGAGNPLAWSYPVADVTGS